MDSSPGKSLSGSKAIPLFPQAAQSSFVFDIDPDSDLDYPDKREYSLKFLGQLAQIPSTAAHRGDV
jgi:hypothetical protein